MKPPQRLLLTAFCALAFIAQRNDAHGDGGQIVHVERSDGLLITVFAAPNPLAAGPIDFSFLVQNATELQLVDAVEIAVTCRLRDKESESISIVAPATRDQATNKLLQAATVNLPTAGKWLVGVAVRASTLR